MIYPFFFIFSSFFVQWSTPLDSRPCSISNVHFTLCMGKSPVLLCTEAWFVHVCVAAQTNDALAHQKGQSRHVYKSARSAISSDHSPSVTRIISSLTLEEAKKKLRKKKLQLCSPPLNTPKQRGFPAAIRRVKSKPRTNFLKSKFQCALLQMSRRECGSCKDCLSQQCPHRGCAH